MRSFEQFLLYAGIACEVALLVVLWCRGVARRLPLFSGYIVWTVFSDVAAAVLAHGNPVTYFHFYKVEFVVDSSVQFLVLLELAHSAFRTLPAFVARGAAIFLMLIFTGLGVVLWFVVGRWSRGTVWPAEWSFLLRVQLSASLLRILFLVLLGGMIEFLGRHFIPIGWGERELQVATGLGIYALATLAASLRLFYPMSGPVLEAMDLVVAMSFLGVVVYWIVSFLKQERRWLPELPPSLKSHAPAKPSENAPH